MPDARRSAGNFLDDVSRKGGVVLEPRWLGGSKRHQVLCPNGHKTSPKPYFLRQGGGICGICGNHDQRSYYVVASDWMVKPGITKADPRSRLANHRKFQLDDVHRLVTGLPQGAARHVERIVLDRLAAEGVTPRFGAEYFHGEWLDLVLATVDDVLGNELVAVGTTAARYRATAD